MTHTALREKGFSLIELLIVIAVIGLLSTVVISAINITKAKSQDNAVKTTMKQMSVEAENYRTENPHFGQSIVSAAVSNCAGGLFDDPRVDNLEAGILRNALATATLTCTTDDSGAFWSIMVSELHGGGTWCVDNQGGFKASATNNLGQCQ